MEHPLISNLDNLTPDQLQEKINELYKKLNIAARSGNGYMCDQIRMAIESYQAKYQEKLKGPGGTPFDEVIDIS
jgi:hypothetical protein